MTDPKTSNGSVHHNGHDIRSALKIPGQVVLVFQGGGALGAYQAGVFQALSEAGITPDWIIGTSIGAINAGLIAGNAPNNQLPALQEFWHRMAQKTSWNINSVFPQLAQTLSFWQTLTTGLPGFFEPNPLAMSGPHMPLGSERAGYYSTQPLRATLTELLDVARFNTGTPRLTIGAAEVRSSRMKYFDSRDTAIDLRHILASGALPPAFPPVRIGEELYWDGGILSNTPSEVVFEDFPRRNSLIFAVHLWNPSGPEPATIWDVLQRQKEIQYSSRITSHITRQQQTHRLRHVISELARHIPESARKTAYVQDLADYGCRTQMHVVRLMAPRLDNEDQTKDVDFSAQGIESRWKAGLADTRRAIERAPWISDFDPIEGVILHELDSPEPPPTRDIRAGRDSSRILHAMQKPLAAAGE
jgi:NTE family protein